MPNQTLRRAWFYTAGQMSHIAHGTPQRRPQAKGGQLQSGPPTSYK